MIYRIEDKNVNQKIVNEIADAYAYFKQYIERYKLVSNMSDDINDKKKKISTIEGVTYDLLDEDDFFIISNEVLKGKKGNWYLGYLSPSTYYRQRAKAYANFLSCLER